MGCRARVPAVELLRVVAVSGEVVADPRRRLPGRGAHVHPTTECLEVAVRRNAFPRALRVSGTLDSTALHARLVATPLPAPQPQSPTPQLHDRSKLEGSADAEVLRS